MKGEWKRLQRVTPEQVGFITDLWFVWGNNGEKHAMSNHKFIQGIIEQREYDAKFFNPNPELLRVVDAILGSVVRRQSFGPCEKCGRKTFNEIETSGRWAHWCGCV